MISAFAAPLFAAMSAIAAIGALRRALSWIRSKGKNYEIDIDKGRREAENSRSIPATVTDIGERGVGLSSKQKLIIGNVLSFSLSLAGTKRPIYIQARVLWTREYATAGCEFLRVPPVDLDILRDWLKRKTRVKKPLISM